MVSPRPSGAGPRLDSVTRLHLWSTALHSLAVSSGPCRDDVVNSTIKRWLLLGCEEGWELQRVGGEMPITPEGATRLHHMEGDLPRQPCALRILDGMSAPNCLGLGARQTWAGIKIPLDDLELVM